MALPAFFLVVFIEPRYNRVKTRKGKMKTQSTNQISNPQVKCLIFGAPGIGKTHLASTLPTQSVLVISFEAGLLTLQDHDVSFIDMVCDDHGKIMKPESRIKKLSDLYNLLNTDEYKAKYKTIFIDSLSEISQVVHSKLAEKFKDEKQALKLWGEYDVEMRAIVKSFRDLPHYNVIFVAVDKQDKDDLGRTDITLSLKGSIRNDVAQYFDEVFYIFKNEKNERTFQTAQQPRSMAPRDRSRRLDPFESAEKGLTYIFDKINSKLQTTNKEK